jgi:hypothetical protein
MPIGTVGQILHRKVTTQPNVAAYDVSANAWNDSQIISSLAPDGYIFVKDSSAPDGWSLVASTAVPNTVTGNLIINGNLQTNGSITSTGLITAAALTVSGVSTLASASFSGAVTMAGSTTMSGTVIINGLVNPLTISTAVYVTAGGTTAIMWGVVSGAYFGTISNIPTYFVDNNAIVGGFFPSRGFALGSLTPVDPGANSLSVGGQIKTSNGAAGAPSYAFTSDPTTGHYYAAGGGTADITFVTLGVPVFQIQGGALGPAASLLPQANGANGGCYLVIGHNTSGTPAPGTLILNTKAGVAYYEWVDTGGLARVGTTLPNNANSDTTGTIIGTQTSTRDAKTLLGAGIAPREALAMLLQTPVHKFQYKWGEYGGTVFHGIVADECPALMMDPSPLHPEGRSFNPVSATGYVIQSIKALEDEIATLRDEVIRLRKLN